MLNVQSKTSVHGVIVSDGDFGSQCLMSIRPLTTLARHFSMSATYSWDVCSQAAMSHGTCIQILENDVYQSLMCFSMEPQDFFYRAKLCMMRSFLLCGVRLSVTWCIASKRLNLQIVIELFSSPGSPVMLVVFTEYPTFGDPGTLLCRSESVSDNGNVLCSVSWIRMAVTYEHTFHGM